MRVLAIMPALTMPAKRLELMRQQQQFMKFHETLTAWISAEM